MTRTQILQGSTALAAALVAALAWNHWYVQPREQYLLAVAECTGADASRAAWDRCAEEVRAEMSDN